MPQIGWENLLCLFVDWWLSFNYVFLTLVQIFGFIAALFLLFKPTRQKGLYILLLLFLAYLIPLEVANYSGCAKKLEKPSEAPKEITTEELLNFPEKKL